VTQPGGVDHHERITRRTSPASQNLNDIEGAANANAKVLEVFARSWVQLFHNTITAIQNCTETASCWNAQKM